MVAIRARLRDWIQGIENTVLWHLVNWIVARRGVEFVYWVNPDSWEKYMSEPMDATEFGDDERFEETVWENDPEEIAFQDRREQKMDEERMSHGFF